MNISALARKLRVDSRELLEVLPVVGFDIGRRAIKVDDNIARKIINQWPQLIDQYRQLKASAEKEEVQELKPAEKKIFKLPAFITVKDFAIKVEMPITKVLAQLMKNGMLTSINEKIDYDTASIIGSDLGLEIIPEQDSESEDGKNNIPDRLVLDGDPSRLKPRPPVIVVMGHVDHGKTKLLDTIRTTNVMMGESGGITQHIGAYQIEKQGRLITFIDTPGHEAFSTMRSRGARVADIAILVVAADDGIKPQTLESIKIINSAKIPMVVAINKIDKPEANIEKVKQELAQNNLAPEDWGGKTICQPISAKTGKGVDELLETLLLLADLDKEKISADPDREAQGTIVESHIDKGEGPVATVLVQNGTLKKGDLVTISGNYFGKVRALKDFKGRLVESAPPSIPVRIIGLKAVPSVGDILQVNKDADKRGKLSDYKLKNQAASAYVQVSSKKRDINIAYINIVIKADVLGSLEAIIGMIDKLQNPEVRVEIVGKGLGSISEGDILAAESNHAVILGFHSTASLSAQQIAQEKGIEIKTYKVIYDLINDLKVKIEKCLKPEIIRHELGRIKILAVFRKDQKSMIVGGQITKGKAESGAKADVIREKTVVATGVLTQLQMNKEEVKECAIGQECGIKYEGKPVIAEGDFLEVYTEEIKKRKIAACIP